MTVSGMSGNAGQNAEARSQKDSPNKPQLVVDTNSEIEGEPISANDGDLMIEIRGGRTGGALPTSMALAFPPATTVLQIKAKLADTSNESKKLSPSGIKLVFEGRALDNSETLLGMAGDTAQPKDITIFALLDTSDNGTRTQQSPVKAAPARTQSLPASPNSGPGKHFGARGQSEPSSPGKIALPPSAVAGWEEEMRKKIEVNMKKAFWASLEASISPSKPGEQADLSWIIKLYGETRDRLCALTPRREDIRQQIHAALDLQLFERMVTHNAFEARDLYGMVEFTFERLAGLCSPARDDEVKAHRAALTAMIGQEGTTFAKFAVAFLRAFHETVDCIEADIAAFKAQVQQAHSAPPPPPAAAAACASSPAGGTRELKERLGQLGVSEEVVAQCVEKRELEGLVEKALGRAAGTVSGAIPHTSILPARTASSASRTLDLGHALTAETRKVQIPFAILAKDAPPSTRQLSLPLSGSIADARCALAALLSSDSLPVLPNQLQLVFAGRILSDADTIEGVHRPDTPAAAVHVVVRSA